MILVDIDGCVINYQPSTSYLDWLGKLDQGRPNHDLIDLLEPHINHAMFVTSRNETLRDETMNWFHTHWPAAIERSMGFRFREPNDTRPSQDVKRDLVDEIARQGYPKPTLAVDDKLDNIRMFQSLGIPTIQVTTKTALLLPGVSG